MNVIGHITEPAAAGASATALHGLGGMGKTEVALAYAHAFAWDYPGGRWLARCEGLDNFDQVLRQLAEPLGVAFTEDEQKDTRRSSDRILAELRHRQRSLLLLDNVTNPELFGPEVLMRLPPQGHVHLLPADQIALPWLRAVGSEQFPVLNPTKEAVDDTTWKYLADSLLSLRLIQPGSDAHVARMHRLVQEFTTKGAADARSILEPALLAHIKSRADFLCEGWMQHEQRWELAPLVACAWQWMERGSSDGTYIALDVYGPGRGGAIDAACA